MIMDFPSQETSNQWRGQSPLGADNTTDSLSDDAGSQISVISFKNINADLTGVLTSSGVGREMY